MEECRERDVTRLCPTCRCFFFLFLSGKHMCPLAKRKKTKIAKVTQKHTQCTGLRWNRPRPPRAGRPCGQRFFSLPRRCWPLSLGCPGQSVSHLLPLLQVQLNAITCQSAALTGLCILTASLHFWHTHRSGAPVWGFHSISDPHPEPPSRRTEPESLLLLRAMKSLN